MQSPLISTIIPVFNGEKYLAGALDSIFNQDYQPHEVIVVDDGSTDATAAIAKSYSEVRYVWQPNQGHGVAKNTGLKVSTGELIAFLDADDEWTAGKSLLEIDYLAANPDAGCVVGTVKNFLEAGVVQPAWVSNEMLSEDWKAYSLGTLLAHRWVFETIGNFNPGYINANDLDWFVRLVDARIVLGILPTALLKRRIHPSNMSITSVLTVQDRVRILKGSIDRKRANASQLQPAAA